MFQIFIYYSSLSLEFALFKFVLSVEFVLFTQKTLWLKWKLIFLKLTKKL